MSIIEGKLEIIVSIKVRQSCPRQTLAEEKVQVYVTDPHGLAWDNICVDLVQSLLYQVEEIVEKGKKDEGEV